ncbi:hypothetical protein [Kitasatospora sp. NPDC001547]|uniref:hypothetical protein n=1 Tax=Kitasatospora sp. NPDC001547 TaxID=3364015 RepID=UPI00368A8B84
MTITIGVRVDFWDKPATVPDGESGGYLCSVVKENASTALAVPAVGDAFSATSLLLGPLDGRPYIRTPTTYPFHTVRVVEHYPRPVGDGREPGVNVVLHTRLGYEGEYLEELVRVYTEAGWHWMPGESEAVARAVEATRPAAD